ncbi:twin-arginine translocation signal domain-containing protein [Streptomyces sp. NPDC048281]|uniref:twin-arginine translocation signal domain-containing protein n=1 Tax=Streptomyces sp. NPDC048281 TaxID=3154715 RepID=UPI003438D7B1
MHGSRRISRRSVMKAAEAAVGAAGFAAAGSLPPLPVPAPTPVCCTPVEIEIGTAIAEAGPCAGRGQISVTRGCAIVYR